MVVKSLSDRRGKYGRSKFRAFTVLEQLGNKYGRDGWLSTRELVLLSGLPYHSLSKLLSKWVRYEYVKRRECPMWGLGDYEYKLVTHGQEWLVCARKRLYNRDKFRSELIEWLRFVERLFTEYDISTAGFSWVVNFVSVNAPKYSRLY